MVQTKNVSAVTCLCRLFLVPLHPGLVLFLSCEKVRTLYFSFDVFEYSMVLRFFRYSGGLIRLH